MSDVLDALSAAKAAIRSEAEARASLRQREATGEALPQGVTANDIDGDPAPLLLTDTVKQARPVIVTPAATYTGAEMRRKNAIVLAAPAARAELGALTATLARPEDLFPAEPAASHAIAALGGVRVAFELGRRATDTLMTQLGVTEAHALFEDPAFAALALEAAAGPLIEQIERATGVALVLEQWNAGPRLDTDTARQDRLEWVVDGLQDGPERAALCGDSAILDLALDHLGRAAAEAGGGAIRAEAVLQLPAALRLPSTRLTLAEISRLEPGDLVLDGFDWRDLRLCVSRARWRVALEEDKRVSILETASPTEAAVEAELSHLPEAASDADSASISDAELAVSFELARTTVPLSTARRLEPGFVFPLDRAVSAEVDIIVSNRRFGRGRIVEIDGEIGVEIVRVG